MQLSPQFKRGRLIYGGRSLASMNSMKLLDCLDWIIAGLQQQEMALNCKRVIVSSIRLSHALFADYVDDFRLKLQQSLPPAIVSDILRVVPEDSFVEEVLADEKNVGICFTEVGMKESSELNRCKGIRAAVVPNKYLAHMCRRHNDANICVFGVDCLGIKLCSQLAMTYLTSGFDQEERNILRLSIMADYQKEYEQVVKPF